MLSILHDDWSIRLGENRSDQILKQLVAMLCRTIFKISIFHYSTKKREHSFSILKAFFV